MLHGRNRVREEQGGREGDIIVERRVVIGRSINGGEELTMEGGMSLEVTLGRGQCH